MGNKPLAAGFGVFVVSGVMHYYYRLCIINIVLDTIGRSEGFDQRVTCLPADPVKLSQAGVLTPGTLKTRQYIPVSELKIRTALRFTGDGSWTHGMMMAEFLELFHQG